MTSFAAPRATRSSAAARPARRVARAFSSARASLAGSFEAYEPAARKPVGEGLGPAAMLMLARD